MKKYILAAATVTCGILFQGCTSHTSDHAHWSYDGETGPSHWGDLNPAWSVCMTGKVQSPINIDNAVEASCCNLEFSYGKQSINLVNNGHTIKQSFDKGNSITIMGKTYNLLQVHFHSLSEHTIKGAHSPMEAHFVHQADNGDYAVVGVMLVPGKENSVVETLWKNIPEEHNKAVETKDTFDINALLPAKKSFYTYNGSFTTPPGTEGVAWYVMDTPVEISPSQLETFKKYYDHNFRPVQKLNGRQIKHVAVK